MDRAAGWLRGVIIGIIGLNLLHLSLLYFYPVPECGPGSLDISCNFPGYLNEIVLDGFRWNSPAFDPSGVGNILPAIATVLFGVLAGRLLLQSERNSRDRLLQLVATGLILIATGELLAVWVPINKQLYTSSFAILMAGVAMIYLACFIWLVDGRPLPRSLRPLEILGVNAIAAYLISRLVQNMPRVHVLGRSFYDDFLSRVASPPNASLLFATLVLAIVLFAVWLMARRNWQLKF